MTQAAIIKGARAANHNGPAPVKLESFEDNASLSLALAEKVASLLTSAIESRGAASIAVSGGSTPRLFFEALSRQAIAWESVTVTLVDERWVDGQHASSNAKLVRETLLVNAAATAQFIDLYTGSADPFTAETEVANRLRKLNGKLDVVVLGMGPDGHTASLFPESQPLELALEPRHGEPCCGITKAGLEQARMTLTLPMILNAKQIFLHTTGAEKWQVIQQALQLGAVEELPIRAILRQHQTPVTLYHSDA